jgi:hypothetical protein
LLPARSSSRVRQKLNGRVSYFLHDGRVDFYNRSIANDEPKREIPCHGANFDSSKVVRNFKLTRNTEIKHSASKGSSVVMDAPLMARVEALLEAARRRSYKSAVEVYHGTVSVLKSLYGPECEQVSSLRNIAAKTLDAHPGSDNTGTNMLMALEGALISVKDELDGGLIGDLQKRIASDVLTDFIQLARAVLSESGDNAKNVAAVLAAAAYEDTIRRMGAAFAGLVGRDDLSEVIDALKKQKILVAPQLGIAQSYLNFRNHALHANWDKIDLSSVHSVLGFVEQLLLKHFG